MCPAPLVAGLFALACAWLLPLEAWLPGPFTAHMTRHMTVVAVAAPLFALAAAGRALDPARKFPAPGAAVGASILELVVVWAWHAPALHAAARTTAAGFAAEQAAFFAGGFLLWAFALGGGARGDRGCAAAGVVALLLTSMHMTLLGALLALAPRALYGHHGAHAARATVGALEDQQLGGALMLVVGGVVYLAGALGLAARVLRQAPPRTAAWRLARGAAAAEHDP